MTANLPAISAFYDATQRAIRDAQTVAQLEKVKPALDGATFRTLPDPAQEDLLHQYSLRHFQISGAFVP